MAPPLVLELGKDLQQRAQMRGPQRARPADFLLMLGQIGRQAPLPQNAQRAGTQFPQIELFGLAVLLIIIPAGAAIAGRQPRGLETAAR